MTGYDSYKLEMWLLVVCAILCRLKHHPKSTEIGRILEERNNS